jgi:hypothetical protein
MRQAERDAWTITTRPYTAEEIAALPDDLLYYAVRGLRKDMAAAATAWRSQALRARLLPLAAEYELRDLGATGGGEVVRDFAIWRKADGAGLDAAGKGGSYQEAYDAAMARLKGAGNGETGEPS